MGQHRTITVTVPTEIAQTARPLAYVSAATLAQLLDASETTIREWTRTGVLPKPIKISSGATRWKWTDVENRLNTGSNHVEDDPILRASRGQK
ncbi:helix-turn-helix transcriptional regulator [Puniceibacterium confluentis]|uniref:helix-turn-helix transcriptional regulator n=1 Tax=Puniceibacterium confluentis TaxID=1958944 RepID=UPI001C97A648|nr:hypothetical protein [Puniceibacterium confluentis]